MAAKDKRSDSFVAWTTNACLAFTSVDRATDNPHKEQPPYYIEPRNKVGRSVVVPGHGRDDEEVLDATGDWQQTYRIFSREGDGLPRPLSETTLGGIRTLEGPALKRQ